MIIHAQPRIRGLFERFPRIQEDVLAIAGGAAVVQEAAGLIHVHPRRRQGAPLVDSVEIKPAA